MIIWINGPFGVGKTTAAALVAERVAGSRLFDPEHVGYMLTAFIEAPTGDFQDLAVWRRLVVQTMRALDEEYDGTWVAPMSLIRADYRDEILGGLRAAGVDVREFILTMSEARLRARIDADQIDTKARQWRHNHAGPALAEFETFADALFLDAARPPEGIADDIAARALEAV